MITKYVILAHLARFVARAEHGPESSTDLKMARLCCLLDSFRVITVLSVNLHQMAADLRVQGLAIVIMGVSGSGKSTVAQMLAESLGCSLFEADDFHSQANKEKMRNGIPLSDKDRVPWLEALRDAIRKKTSNDETVVLTCSALQVRYRDILRSADPNYKPGDCNNCRVKFVCLKAPREVIADRIRRRSEEGKHFMPASLLQSQLDLLQFDEAEGITMVDATASFASILDAILSSFSTKKIEL